MYNHLHTIAIVLLGPEDIKFMSLFLCSYAGYLPIQRICWSKSWSLQESNKELELQWSKNFSIPMQRYAARFLKYNNSLGPQLQAPAPATPERLSDLGITEMSWEDHLTEVWSSIFMFFFYSARNINADISHQSPPSSLSSFSSLCLTHIDKSTQKWWFYYKWRIISWTYFRFLSYIKEKLWCFVLYLRIIDILFH